jgi:hypothetical protein
MGLAQYINGGQVLKRETLTFTTSEDGSGSVDLGSAYALLAISTNIPCRLRLYDNESSLNNATEIARDFSNRSIPPSIALIGDFILDAGAYTIDPVLYGVVENPTDRLTYYRIDNTPAIVSFTRYLLEDSTIATTNRQNVPAITGSLSAGQLVSGTLASEQISKTYLLVSASLSNNTNVLTRLRLYATTASFNSAAEKTRPFRTEPAANVNLIVDAILPPTDRTTYFVPKIIGANLQTMGNNLNNIRLNLDAILGKNEMYYILQNIESSGGASQVTASVHVFSFED